jgi:hypothetical protein
MRPGRRTAAADRHAIVAPPDGATAMEGKGPWSISRGNDDEDAVRARMGGIRIAFRVDSVNIITPYC